MVVVDWLLGLLVWVFFGGGGEELFGCVFVVFYVGFCFFLMGGSAFTSISCNTGCWIGLTKSWSFTTEDPVACFDKNSKIPHSQYNSEQ